MPDDPRLPLLKLGDFTAFDLYEWVFDRLYKEREIYDVFGHRVIFGDKRFNGPYDSHHVCFGGVNVNWRNPAGKWKQERAERILWIRRALSNPRILVYPDNIPGRLRYLLVIEADPSKSKPQEYLCVILQIVDPNTKAFVTMFDITRQKWEEFKKKGPRYYPIPSTKTSKKKIKARGG